MVDDWVGDEEYDNRMEVDYVVDWVGDRVYGANAVDD